MVSSKYNNQTIEIFFKIKCFSYVKRSILPYLRFKDVNIFKHFVSNFFFLFYILEQVWQIEVQRKGIAEESNLLGNYHLCLSSKTITLIRIGPEKSVLGESRVPFFEFYLTTIRRYVFVRIKLEKYYKFCQL